MISLMLLGQSLCLPPSDSPKTLVLDKLFYKIKNVRGLARKYPAMKYKKRGIIARFFSEQSWYIMPNSKSSTIAHGNELPMVGQQLTRNFQHLIPICLVVNQKIPGASRVKQQMVS